MTVDASTETVNPTRLGTAPVLCFVDGEHTDGVAVRDGMFCRAVLGDRGAIAFHDAQIVYRGIAQLLAELSADSTPVYPYLLPDSIFVIELGATRLHQSPQVRSRIDKNWQGFLFALQFNDGYRRALNRPLARTLRRLRLLTVEGIDEGA